ncbi:MAG: ribonuclease HI family protein [Candidatus Marsarchaeota archaeon]|nr:ribonuclease HI family protein [Candidatus Marsarchaeota archaeon]MCL5101944.1 ribonuclease HI family protein [Candidatus Marsarchaeota archaeon]
MAGKAHGKMVFRIYTDGAARGNPGPSASGFLIVDGSGKEIAHKSLYNGIKTNNFAEYTAIIKALEWCEANLERPEKSELEFISDSELVVRQLNGKYKIRSEEMAKLNATVKELSKWFAAVSFSNRRRSDPGISAVDAKLNELLDSRKS